MSALELARDMAYQRQKAIDEATAGRVYAEEARAASDRGDTKAAQLAYANGEQCARRSGLWAQLAQEIKAFLDQCADPDPRLL